MKVISEHFNPQLQKTIQLGIPETTDEWNAYYNIRYEVLRKPWNQPASSVHVEDDDTAIHFCLSNNNEIIGVCRLHYNSATEGQIRFLAIKKEWQHHQLGDILLSHAEELCVQHQATFLFLQARDNAVPLYLRNGYQVIEKTHLLFGKIQHFSMRKSLQV